MMWHSSSKFSPASYPRHGTGILHGSLQKGKTVAKVKLEEWEPLRGWQDDVKQSEGIETIDIGLWSKKNIERSEDVAKGVHRVGPEVYLCWTSNHCPEIQNYREFVRASLTASLKPAVSTNQTEAKPKTAQDKDGSPKNEEMPKICQQDSSFVQSSEDSSRTLDGQTRSSEKSLDNANFRTCRRSECHDGVNGEDADRESLMAAKSRVSTSAPARSSVVTRSAPASRTQDKTEKSNRKIVSAKVQDKDTNRLKQKRPVTVRNSVAKTSLDLKRLTLDLPSSAPVTKMPNSSSPLEDSAATHAGLQVEKATVLRLVEETIKQSSASKKLNFDLPKSGSMSVGDLLSSNPRIVVGPGGDTERDPNVYAALVGNLNLADHKEPLSPWSHATSDSAIHFGIHQDAINHHHKAQGPSGSRFRDTMRSVLPSVTSGSSVLASAAQFDSTSTGDSVMMRHEPPSDDFNGHSLKTTSDDAKLLKIQKRIVDSLINKTTPPWNAHRFTDLKTLCSAITRYNHKMDAHPRANRRQHRGPPGFRPAGKTPLQRAVESAHKKLHGQHYYLFTHTSNSQSSDGRGLPKHSSIGHLTIPQASSGQSNQSEYNTDNHDAQRGYLQMTRHAEQAKAEYQFQLEGERLC